MAWFRLIWWWHNRRPITQREAQLLRHLLLMQTLAFALTLVAAVLTIYLTKNPKLASYALGFGTGWIAAIRYYVWRYVG